MLILSSGFQSVIRFCLFVWGHRCAWCFLEANIQKTVDFSLFLKCKFSIPQKDSAWKIILPKNTFALDHAKKGICNFFLKTYSKKIMIFLNIVIHKNKMEACNFCFVELITTKCNNLQAFCAKVTARRN